MGCSQIESKKPVHSSNTKKKNRENKIEKKEEKKNRRNSRNKSFNNRRK